jgi:predicted outer membrane lipoprotein
MPSAWTLLLEMPHFPSSTARRATPIAPNFTGRLRGVRASLACALGILTKLLLCMWPRILAEGWQHWRLVAIWFEDMDSTKLVRVL